MLFAFSNIVLYRRKGSWLSYKGETLGQGKEAVAQFLEKNPSVQEEIIRKIMAEVTRGIGFQPQPNPGEDPDAPDAKAESAVSVLRSEERRVGKECRSRWSPYH